MAGAGCAAAEHEDGRSTTTVQVRIHHSTFDPIEMTFDRGARVTFVVRTPTPIEHEFIVGEHAVQLYIEEHRARGHDGSVPGQISIPAGETRTTTYTLHPRDQPALG